MSILVDSNFFIGRLKLENRLIQAPLAGISCAPFRELFSLFIKPAYAVTEMISANSILENNDLINRRYLSHSKNEGKWCIQLSGSDPKKLASAVKICEKYKPDLIDLNCGCPKPKIRAKGFGSALMDNPNKLREVVQALREATNLPLTVKIRTAGQTNDERYLESASIIANSGADAIIVHGRHFSEDYDVPVNYLQIKKISEIVNIPVIANGDIYDLDSLQKALNSSGASAVMIGRASIGKPWLFQQLLTNSLDPSWEERIVLFNQHICQLSILEQNEFKALLQGRRLIKWYFPELSLTQLANCNRIESVTELLNILKNMNN